MKILTNKDIKEAGHYAWRITGSVRWEGVIYFDHNLIHNTLNDATFGVLKYPLSDFTEREWVKLPD
jgi:hypothetical protein